MIAMGARVRLVKGAYLEPESVAFRSKADVDRAFEQLGRRLLDEGVYPALATHDERLIRTLKHYAQERDIEKDRFEWQMLFGIRRDLQESLLREGYNVRVYIPFGPSWYPYFTRRLAERPANVWFIFKALFQR
jgi:proline dehydrogenase